MVSRGTASWLAIAVVALIGASATDYALFIYRQRHGDVLSFTTVKQYIAVADRNGHYHYEYFGTMDVPCVEAFLPHQRMTPCWWVSVHHDHWD